MIRIEMNRLKHTVVLELPTDYEHVLVSLWKECSVLADSYRYLKVSPSYDG